VNLKMSKEERIVEDPEASVKVASIKSMLKTLNRE